MSQELKVAKVEPVPLFHIHPETQALVEFLMTVPVGETVTYETLDALVGADVRSHGWLRTAIDRCREKQIVFGTIVGKGLKHLSDVEATASGERHRRHIGATGRRLVDLMSSMKDFDSMPNESKIENNRLACTGGLIHNMAHKSTAQKIERQLQNGANTTQLLGEVLKSLEKK